MKKIFTILILTGVLFFNFTPVFALDLGSGLAENTAMISGYGEVTQTSLSENIGKVIKAALSFVGVIFTALIVYSGILWMTANGEEAKVEKAKEIIKASIIGIVISLSAYSITAFVVPKILGGGEEESSVQPGELMGCCKACPRGWIVSDSDCRYKRDVIQNSCNSDPEGYCLNINNNCEWVQVPPDRCVD